MAEALLGWARNIIYYMVFLSLAEHLLAGSSYGRYLRLFGGLVLVLVVLGPFGSLGDWEKQVSSLFDQFTFRQESRELKKEIFGMEEKRLAGITGQYRENVEKEITALVKAQGIVCSQVSVQMEENKESSSYGKIFLNRKVSHKRGPDRKVLDGKISGQPGRCFYPLYQKNVR